LTRRKNLLIKLQTNCKYDSNSRLPKLGTGLDNSGGQRNVRRKNVKRNTASNDLNIGLGLQRRVLGIKEEHMDEEEREGGKLERVLETLPKDITIHNKNAHIVAR
jgi:hypothetical protein